MMKKRNNIVLTKIETPEYDYSGILQSFKDKEIDLDNCTYAEIRIDDLNGFDLETFKRVLIEWGYPVYDVCQIDPSLNDHNCNIRIYFNVSLEHFYRLFNKEVLVLRHSQHIVFGCVYHIVIPNNLVDQIDRESLVDSLDIEDSIYDIVINREARMVEFKLVYRFDARDSGENAIEILKDLLKKYKSNIRLSIALPSVYIERAFRAIIFFGKNINFIKYIPDDSTFIIDFKKED